MKEEEKKTTKSKRTVSPSKGVAKTQLNNDELLESILQKKKEKKAKKSTKDFSIINMSVDEIDKLSGEEILNSSSKKKTTTKSSSTTTKKTSTKSKKISEVNNDELYEQIMVKKKAKKSSTKKASLTKNVSKEAEVDKKKEVSLDKEVELKEKEVSSLEVEEKKVEETPKKKEPKKIYDQSTESDYVVGSESKDNLDDIDYLSPDSSLYKNTIDKKIGNRLETHSGRKAAALVILLLILGIIISVVGVVKMGYSKMSDNSNSSEQDIESVIPQVDEETGIKDLYVDNRDELYNECLVRKLNNEDKNAYMKSVQDELTTYLGKYRTSVLYYDLTYGYKYVYNEKETYYAASTIKILDALYLYTKAAEGKISLDSKLTYTSKYARAGSKEMKKHKYGDKVSLRDLVKYEMTVSDNTSHHMLFDYIGYRNLNDFGASIGATKTLSSGEYYGYTTLANEFSYVKYLYEFSLKYPKLGKELLGFMTSSEQNNIALKEHNITASSKYGEYGGYYHNIGIVNAEHPYILIVLTKEGNKNFQNIVHDISLHTYKLNISFYQNRKDVCQVEVYDE